MLSTLQIAQQQVSRKARAYFGKDFKKFAKGQSAIKAYLYEAVYKGYNQITSRDAIENLTLFKKEDPSCRSLYLSFTNHIIYSMVSKGVLIDTRIKKGSCLVYVPDSVKLAEITAPGLFSENDLKIYRTNFKKFKSQFYSFIALTSKSEFTAKNVFDSLTIPQKDTPYLRSKYFNYIHIRLMALTSKGILVKIHSGQLAGNTVRYIKAPAI